MNFFMNLCMNFRIIFLEFIFVKGRYFKQKDYKFLRMPMIQLVLFLLTLLLISSSDGTNYAAYGQR